MYKPTIKEHITILSTMSSELYIEMDRVKLSDPDLARDLNEAIEQYSDEVEFLLELRRVLNKCKIEC